MSKGQQPCPHAASRASTLELAPRARADRASVTWHARASGSQMSARRTVNTRALSARRCEEAALREGPLARAHLERDLSPRARRSRGTAARAPALRSTPLEQPPPRAHAALNTYNTGINWRTSARRTSGGAVANCALTSRAEDAAPNLDHHFQRAGEPRHRARARTARLIGRLSGGRMLAPRS